MRNVGAPPAGVFDYMTTFCPQNTGIYPPLTIFPNKKDTRYLVLVTYVLLCSSGRVLASYQQLVAPLLLRTRYCREYEYTLYNAQQNFACKVFLINVQNARCLRTDSTQHGLRYNGRQAELQAPKHSTKQQQQQHQQRRSNR